MARRDAEGRGTAGSLSRALGAAALPAAALWVGRHLAGTAAALLPGPAGLLLAAALLWAMGFWLAAALRRRLGGADTAPRPTAPPALLGALAGLGLAGALAILLTVTRGVRWQPDSPSAAVAAAIALAAALGYAEEALLRGAAYGVLRARAGRAPALWGAAALGAAVDLLLGAGVVAAAVSLALGLAWGAARERSGTSAFAAGAHAAWNVALGPLLALGGENLSLRLGLARPALLAAHLGAIWWAGAPGPAQGGLAALGVAAVFAAWSLRRQAAAAG